MHVQDDEGVAHPGMSCNFGNKLPSLAAQFNTLMSLKVCHGAPTTASVLLMQWAACTIESTVRHALTAADLSMCECHHVIAAA